MTFGDVLFGLKHQEGAKYQRAGWNGKGMHIAIQTPDANSKMGVPYLYLKSVDGKLVPWAPSQTDVLAEDWDCCE